MSRTVLLVLAFVVSAAAADVAGKWDFTAKLGDRDIKVDLMIKSDAGKLSGTMTTPNGSMELVDVQLTGDDLSFKVPVDGGNVAIKLKVSDGAMKGMATPPDGSQVPVSAVRAGAAAAAGGDDVTGKWKVKATSSGGREYNLTLDVKNEAGKISGTMGSDQGTIPLTEPKLVGKELSFKLVVDADTYAVKLTMGEGGMKGSYTGASANGTVVATR